MAKIVVVATTFPRFARDNQPRFILDLCIELSRKHEVMALIPSSKGFSDVGGVSGVKCSVFRYCLNFFEVLSFGSGILANLKSRPVLWGLVPFFVFGMLLKLIMIIRTERPDVIHAHWWFPVGFVALLAKKITGSQCKILITCHGADYFVLGRRWKRLLSWCFSNAQGVAFVSQSMLDDAVTLVEGGGRFFLAPMGVDLIGKFSPSEKQFKQGVIFIGRLVEKKGVDVLLKGWSGASSSVKKEGLKIVGAGEMKAELVKMAHDLGVSDSVSFVGALNHDSLPNYLGSAKLLVFPSKVGRNGDQEGLGLVAIEAMGCECPVLSSEIPSLAGVIVDQETGFTFSSGCEEELSARLNDLISDVKRLTLVAKAARKFALANYDWGAVGNTYSEIYQVI